MGCMSHRRSNVEIRPEQKWDFIQLNDFKAESAFTYVAYGYLYFSLIISTAVYAVDSFTAVNLLAFNKWSSEIQPAVSLNITKWIFAICIILSIVNLGFEHIRAMRIMKRGSVAESYLDNLAVRLESIRMGSGKGWRRFLVFAELTKSKKGAEYIALFTYFSFQSWIRVIFCSGPRQAVNGITLYSVYTAKLAGDGKNFESSVVDFFDKIKALAEEDYRQALILSGMVFTTVVWVFSFLSLLIATLFFVLFLWGWIPREDGGLSGYCERKINKRLMKIVSAKIDAAIADQERQRKRAELRAAKKTGELPPEERKATLPQLMPPSEEKFPGMPTINRNDTMATLPVYTSRPGTPDGGGGQGFELDQMPVLNRTETGTSTTSSRAPLLKSGAEMGRSSPAPPLPPLPVMKPSMTGGPPPLQRVQTNQSSFGGSYTQTPTTYSPENNFAPMPQPVRTLTSTSINPYGMPPRSNTTPAPRGTIDSYSATGRAIPTPVRQMTSRPTFDDYNDGSNQEPSAMPPPVYPQRGQTQSPRPMAGQQRGYSGGPGGYPMRIATGPLPNNGPPRSQPQRNMTAPIPQPGIQRQGTGEFRILTPVQQVSPPMPQLQRTMTAPVPQPGIHRQGTGEFHSMTPVQQAPYDGSNDYFDTPVPSQARSYPGSPPDEYFNRPRTAQSQRTMDGPPQLDRQPTLPNVGLEPTMISPPPLSRQPTLPDMSSEPAMNSPPQLVRQPSYGSEEPMNSPPQLTRKLTYGNRWTSDLESQRETPGPRY